MADTLDIDRLKTWIGRQETRVDTITPQLLRAFRAMLDRDPGEPAADEAVPQALHWCLAPPTAPMGEIGPDGHPARGGFLPPVPLPRRMWAGGRLRVGDDLRVGDTVERLSTVKDVAMKAGRTGALCFVVIEHQVSTARGLAVVEEHDIVYRGLDAPPAGAPKRADPAQTPDASRTIDPSPVLLFRYSALTYNGHRIHYDRPYVTEVEGYPGLIVHGPLQATLLLQAAAELSAGARVSAFAFRATRPLFDLAPFTVNGRRTGDRGADLWVAGPEGVVHMQATAEWA